MSAQFSPQYWFDLICEAWSPFATSHRIIPFCTPVFQTPSAVIVGTNHSDFVEGGGEEAERIADELAAGVPTESTFQVHDHKFARGLREVCNRTSDIRIDETWMGTNRCAVQTGPDGLKEIKSNPRFSECDKKMDGILRDLIAELAPRNVILVGKRAAELFYNKAGSTPLASLKPRDIRYPGADGTTRVIAIPHPSRAAYWQQAADILAKHFQR